MRLFNTMSSALGRMLGIFGLGRSGVAAAPATHIAVAATAVSPLPGPLAGPAVASWYMRLPVDRFLLARRLASVAKLNTPIGRKPRMAGAQAAGTPPLPTSRVGAKKQRIGGNHGPRVLRQVPQQARSGATIIAFPTAPAATSARANSVRRAA